MFYLFCYLNNTTFMQSITTFVISDHFKVISAIFIVFHSTYYIPLLLLRFYFLLKYIDFNNETTLYKYIFIL